MEWNLALLIYAVVQFIAFMLVLVATLIDMFRLRSDGIRAFTRRCITVWGLKLDCTSAQYDIPMERLWVFCPARRNHFHAAQAFAVVSILVYGAAFVLGVIMLFCCRVLRWACLTLNVVGAVTLCIVLAALAAIYNRDEGPSCVMLKLLYSYGAGFVLVVLAWILDLLNIATLLLLFPDSDSDESGKGTKSRG